MAESKGTTPLLSVAAAAIPLSPRPTAAHPFGLAIPSATVFIAAHWFRSEAELHSYARAAGWDQFGVTTVPLEAAQPLTVGELFAGIGGSAIGLEKAGMRLAWYSEIEPYASAVMKKHWPEAPNHGDICAMRVGPVERVDVLAGGFPCQDISNAGKRAGLAGERSGLWWEFHRLIDEIEPSYAIIENVSALRGRGLDAVLGSLAEIGYDAEWHCIPAAAVGAPHRRDRVWIIAYPNADRERLTQWGQRDSDAAQPRFETSLGYDAGGFREDVADANSARRDDAEDAGTGRGNEGAREAEEGRRAAGHQELERGSAPSIDVADADLQRLEGRLRAILRECAVEQLAGAGDPSPGAPLAGHPGWLVEPGIRRVADGVPNRVDRLRCLGNASVPQISEILGRAVIADHAMRDAP